MKQLPHRTIQRVVDIEDMLEISAEQLLLASRDRYNAIRRAATIAHKNEKEKFVCGNCGFPVYAPKKPDTRLPYWKHYPGFPVECEWRTDKPQSVDQVSAIQFAGNQESSLHKRIKEATGEMLLLDPLTSDGSVIIDEYLIEEDGRRRPDVRCQFNGRPVAFEVQLATTQLPIILDRDNFYASHGWHLIWITWGLEIPKNGQLLTAFEDIFYSHNKNIFSLDSEAISMTKSTRKFHLRCHWQEELSWASQLVPLSELNWEEGRLPYFKAQPPTWKELFQGRWIATLNEERLDIEGKRALLNELLSRIGMQSVERDVAYEICEIVDLAFSLKVGQPIASSQSNLVELYNSFLSSERRFKYAKMVYSFALITGHRDLLERISVKKKLDRALRNEQTEKNNPASVVARYLLESEVERYEEVSRLQGQ